MARMQRGTKFATVPDDRVDVYVAAGWERVRPARKRKAPAKKAPAKKASATGAKKSAARKRTKS